MNHPIIVIKKLRPVSALWIILNDICLKLSKSVYLLTRNLVISFQEAERFLNHYVMFWRVKSRLKYYGMNPYIGVCEEAIIYFIEERNHRIRLLWTQTEKVDILTSPRIEYHCFNRIGIVRKMSLDRNV